MADHVVENVCEGIYLHFNIDLIVFFRNLKSDFITLREELKVCYLGLAIVAICNCLYRKLTDQLWDQILQFRTSRTS